MNLSTSFSYLKSTTVEAWAVKGVVIGGPALPAKRNSTKPVGGRVLSNQEQADGMGTCCQVGLKALRTGLMSHVISLGPFSSRKWQTAGQGLKEVRTAGRTPESPSFLALLQNSGPFVPPSIRLILSGLYLCCPQGHKWGAIFAASGNLSGPQTQSSVLTAVASKVPKEGKLLR
jgi:hypothetical protein